MSGQNNLEFTFSKLIPDDIVFLFGSQISLTADTNILWTGPINKEIQCADINYVFDKELPFVQISLQYFCTIIMHLSGNTLLLLHTTIIIHTVQT